MSSANKRKEVRKMKLKHRLILKCIEKKLTKAELDFLLELVKYQTEDGIVRGVYYKDIMEKINISYQTFYDIKKSLEKKGMLRSRKIDYTDHEIVIIDNQFVDKDGNSKMEVYLNLNLSVFDTDEFKKLKSGEKLLMLEFLRLQMSGKCKFSIKIGVSVFFEKYRALFGVQKRVLKSYLVTLKQFFSIGIKDNMYYITVLKTAKTKRNQTESFVKHMFDFKVLCREFKIKIDIIKDIKKIYDILNLIKQYSKFGCTFLVLRIAIIKALIYENKVEVQNLRKCKNKELNPKLIHFFLRQVLNIA